MNRVAVVTGAARGIGAATVRGLAAAGWAVVAVDRAGDDPRLPYPMGTESELHGVVASAQALVPRPRRHRRAAARSDRLGGGRHHRSRGAWPVRWQRPRSGSAGSMPWSAWPG